MNPLIFTLLATAAYVSARTLPPQPSDCPATPDVDTAGGVPIKPENVPQGCNDFKVLVARGTGEPDFAPDGKFGVVVGDPLVSNLTEILPNARGYPVHYPASASLTSPPRGSRDVTNRLLSQSRACSNQKFALVGYFQGAVVIRRAVQSVPASVQRKIVAWIGYGDPARRQGNEDDLPSGLADRDLQICAGAGTPDSDPVCDGGGRGCIYFHLTYIQQRYIDQGVGFLVERFNASST